MITEIVKVDEGNIRLDANYDDLSQLNDDEAALVRGAAILKDGGLVAFPTETVYGIGADALDVESVQKIFKAKGRPNDNPLIVHIGDQKDLEQYIQHIPPYAHALMERFWPGPLTMVFKKQPIVPDEITGGLDTVAIRMPKNNIARKLIQLSGCPVAAPSANISGKPSPTRGYHVTEDLNGKVDMIIDGGSVDIGLESTVLDVTSQVPVILRPGQVTKEMIETVVNHVEIDVHLKSPEATPKSPGMKYKHYAPKGHLTIYHGDEALVIEAINAEAKKQMNLGKKVGIVSTTSHMNIYVGDVVLDVGDTPDEIAASLFKVLRKMDALNVDVILTRSIEENAIGFATMNRLSKAAGYNIVHV